jgi:photosystem II stability/assembly factor-like uncharacterized protein
MDERMRRFIILIVAALSSQMASAQGWEPQTSPTINNLNAVVFVDSSRGWAVGNSGSILHTTDGGGTWSIQASGTTINLNDVDFLDMNTGWAVGTTVDQYGDRGNFIVLHTTDGGAAWATQSSDSGFYFSSVDFVDENHGWIAGAGSGGYWQDTFPAIILYTSDAGVSWTLQDSSEYVLHAFANLNEIEFVDENNGWAVGGYLILGYYLGEKLIFRTTNAGVTWTQSTREGYPLRGMDVLNTTVGWAVGGHCAPDGMFMPVTCDCDILNSTDGGVGWTALENAPWYSLNDVKFVDANHGWAVGGVGEGLSGWDIHDVHEILYTSDAGLTWTVQDSGVAELQSVDFVDANHGWAVGESGTILRYNLALQAGDEHRNLQPSSFKISSYPNPFNPSTTIAFDLPTASHISLRVFDLLGREVAVLTDGFVEAGTHRTTFDGSKLTSGIYFVRLDAGKFSQTQKLMLLK